MPGTSNSVFCPFLCSDWEQSTPPLVFSSFHFLVCFGSQFKLCSGIALCSGNLTWCWDQNREPGPALIQLCVACFVPLISPGIKDLSSHAPPFAEGATGNSFPPSGLTQSHVFLSVFRSESHLQWHLATVQESPGFDRYFGWSLQSIPDRIYSVSLPFHRYCFGRKRAPIP